MSPKDLVEQTAKPILEFGRAWISAPATAERGAGLGLEPPFGFWVNGRAGVLGEVDSDVVAAAVGFMARDHIRRFWESRPTGLSPAAAVEQYVEAAGEWGRATLSSIDSDDLDELASLANRVADGADPSVGVLFAGWRALARPNDPAAAATVALNVLREHRGGAHLSAVHAAGIGPVGAIMAAPDPVRGGAKGAARFGWPPPYPRPDEARRAEAEAMTTTICRPAYEGLNPTERERFASLIRLARAAIDE